MIILNNISKGYGSQVVLANVSFTLNRGEKAGIVGRNGGGKTTLLKIITGYEEADEGEVIISKNYSLGILDQTPEFQNGTVLEEVFHLAAEKSEPEEWQVKKILGGLGFQEQDMNRGIHEFSGGYQMRVALAAALVSEPDCLILDEPTNFLDIHAICWLESFLRDWKNELLVVSHDRSFLDSFVTHIAGIFRNKLKKIKGSSKEYYEQILLEDEIYEKKRVNEEKKRKQTEEFITKFRAKARQASLAQSRVKSLEKKEVMEELVCAEKLDFSFNLSFQTPRYSLESRQLTFAYDNNAALFNNLDFTLFKDDKICVIGKNGKGKSTLLRVLAGELMPSGGNLRIHPKTQSSFFAQANTLNLDKNLTIEQEIFKSLGSEDRKRARSICGMMMFSQDLALKKIGVLSGGEKCRVLIGKMLAAPANTLLLDEPTHHLDMDSTEALGDALVKFAGAVILVTHNEYLIRKVARKLIVFNNGQADLYEGGYDEFLKTGGWKEDLKNNNSLVTKKNFSKKDDRRKRAEYTALRSKILSPLKKEITSIEKKIALFEEQIKKLDEETLLISAGSDWQRLKEIADEKRKAELSTDDCYLKLITLNEELEAKEAELSDE